MSSSLSGSDNHHNSMENDNADLLEWKAFCGVSIQVISIFLFAAEHVIDGYEKRQSELGTDSDSLAITSHYDPENRTISVSDMSNAGLTEIINELMARNLISTRDINYYLDIGNLLSGENMLEISELSVLEKLSRVSIEGLIKLFNSSDEIRDFFKEIHENLDPLFSEAFNELGLNPDIFNGI